MKKSYLFALVACLLAMNVYSQSVAINEDGSAPNPNAILDVKSFTKGILIPRLSTTGRLAIPNTKGLLVYDTTTNSFWFNTGTAWQNLAAASTANGWSLTGNSGTTAANFLGTTDNIPLVVKVNNSQSGRIETGFAENTYWGYSSGVNAKLDSARHNTGIGGNVLFTNTAGSFNTAMGARSMFVNKASDNTAAGAFTLVSNTTGFSNTAIGSFALQSNQTGEQNTAVGAYALNANTSYMFDNTAVGANAMRANTFGSSNAAFGVNAMRFSTNGWYNAAFGRMVMYRNTTGSDNTAVGTNAMNDNTTGSINTGVGEAALHSNLTGHYNTGLGVQALFYNKSGMFNTAIGAYAGVTSVSSNLTNTTAIGAEAVVNASNKVRIGNSAVTVIEGQVPFTTPSDGRYKFQVKEDVKGLDFILQLRPVTYQFDTKRFDDQLRGDRNTIADTLLVYPGKPARASNDVAMQAAFTEASAIRRSGFVAQEVEKAATASGYNFSGIIKPKTEQEHYSLSYESFVVPLVKAMQEQQKIIVNLQKQIDELKKQPRNGE